MYKVQFVKQIHSGLSAVSSNDVFLRIDVELPLVPQKGMSFILSLNPGEDLESRLNAFRFSSDHQKDPNEEKRDPAQEPRELILAGLKLEKEKKEDIKTQTDQK